jgi:hypothetical protein
MRNRLRRLWIAEELLLDLFAAGQHSGYSVVHNAIPAGARLVSVGWAGLVRDNPTSPRTAEFILESEEFSPVAQGDVIPYLSPVCERTRATIRLPEDITKFHTNSCFQVECLSCKLPDPFRTVAGLIQDAYASGRLHITSHPGHMVTITPTTLMRAD